MIDLGDNKYIIGFDNGYQFGKTANLMFDNGGSLASVAKARIKLSYENATDSDLKEQIVEIIQDEMQKSSMKIVGALDFLG